MPRLAGNVVGLTALVLGGCVAEYRPPPERGAATITTIPVVAESTETVYDLLLEAEPRYRTGDRTRLGVAVKELNTTPLNERLRARYGTSLALRTHLARGDTLHVPVYASTVRAPERP